MAKERVLIVDDEVDVLDLCKRILLAQGYQVQTAHNGYEAIDIANNHQSDVLLTDIKMPGMSGLEIAQELKEIDPNLICVTMTGFSTMDMAINALKLGIDEFILKPFTPKELSAAISKALEKERLRKENFRLRSLIPLFELNKTLMTTIEEQNVLKSLLEIAQQETKATFAGVYLVENDIVSQPIFINLSPEQQLICDELAQTVCQNNTSSVLTLNAANPDHQLIMERLQAAAVVAIPMKSQNSCLGVLILGNSEDRFAPSDKDFLTVLCGQAAIALQNAQLFTEKQQAYEQLKMLDHMKSEFINIAAHELRTPLAILMGYATVLEEELPPGQQPYVSNISRNALRLRALIDDILNLKVLESGIPVLAQDKIDLHQVVESIRQDLALQADEKKLQLNVKIPLDFPEMTADRQKLDLILVNLFHNAVKFTPSSGSITVWAEANGSHATISVQNSGSIIPKEKQSQIFDRFYQVEATLTREHGGAGLGLAIVRGMVQVCGGSIRVESSEEAGTTFTFTMPLDNTNLKARKLEL